MLHGVLASHSQNGNRDTGCRYYSRMRWALVIMAVVAAHAPSLATQVGERPRDETAAKAAGPATSTRDLEGVWSFATLTPFERPAEFAGRAFVSDADAAEWARQQLERGNRDRRDGGA